MRMKALPHYSSQFSFPKWVHKALGLYYTCVIEGRGVLRLGWFLLVYLQEKRLLQKEEERLELEEQEKIEKENKRLEERRRETRNLVAEEIRKEAESEM